MHGEWSMDDTVPFCKIWKSSRISVWSFPILLLYDRRRSTLGRKKFHFKNAWLLASDILEVVRQGWVINSIWDIMNRINAMVIFYKSGENVHCQIFGTEEKTIWLDLGWTEKKRLHATVVWTEKWIHIGARTGRGFLEIESKKILASIGR